VKVIARKDPRMLQFLMIECVLCILGYNLPGLHEVFFLFLAVIYLKCVLNRQECPEEDEDEDGEGQY